MPETHRGAEDDDRNSPERRAAELPPGADGRRRCEDTPDAPTAAEGRSLRRLIPYGQARCSAADGSDLARFPARELEARFAAPKQDESTLEAFERQRANAHGARHAICLANGVKLLTMILSALGIGNGHAVLAPITLEDNHALPVEDHSVLMPGVGLDPSSLGIDPDDVDRRLTDIHRTARRVRAVLVEHAYDRLADAARLAAVCKAHGVDLIEQSTRAVLSTWQGLGPGGCLAPPRCRFGAPASWPRARAARS